MMTHSNPFPGIRPFEEDESELFFGRETEIDELLRRLGARSPLLALTGASGCGKSSLVRAGLLPALNAGLLAGSGSQWRIAILRPGQRPCANLAFALSSNLGQFAAEHVEQTLRRSSLGLIDAVRQAQLQPKESLLIGVDQFEEILHYGDRDEAVAFVKLLFEATRQREVPIYVLLTFRSDFLGDFADFRHLPEAFNEGLYLMPRMKRDQLRLAIEGPAGIIGASFSNRLMQRLLNNVSDNHDYLVLMQHALKRTWDAWLDWREGNSPIDLMHYERVGGIAALNLHAEETFAELPDDESRRIAITVFQRLTGEEADGRSFRRPAILSEFCAVTTQHQEVVRAVVDHFYRAGFLLENNGVIDLPHDSLIRQWFRLHGWMKDEARSAALYRDVANAAHRHTQGAASLWREPELGIALRWLQLEKPNRAWAERYDSRFEEAMHFLAMSEEASNEERGFWRRFWKRRSE
jgi:hypothetical protein